MANPLPKTTHIGTLGELLVQLRLLEFGVQAAPPIRDSGNDLIAIKGRVVKFIQVKSKVNRKPPKSKPHREYDFICRVDLRHSGYRFLLDDSKIIVNDRNGNDLGELDANLVNNLWV